METIFDWVSLGIFAGLIVLFLQRSSEDEPRDSLWQYLAAAVGCAVANYVGNEVSDIGGIAVIAAVLAYVFIVLKPLEGWKRS